jgi:hypothetical protein
MQPGFPQHPNYGPPQYGAPYPYPGPPMAPPNKSRKTLFIVLGVALLGFIAMIGGIVAVVVKATAPARDAGHAFLADLRDRDYEEAWDQASPALQREIPKEDFQQAIETQLPETAKMTDVTFNQTNITNNQACLSGSMDTSSGSVPIHMRLVKVGDAWRVEAVAKAPISGCR